MRSTSRSLRLRALLIGLLTIVVASGCVRVNLNIDIREDGSGTTRGLVALNGDQFAAIFEGFGEGFGEELDGAENEFSREAICSSFLEDEGIEADGVTSVEPYDQDGFCGAIITQEFGPGELDSVRAELDAGAVLEQRADGGWTFELPFSQEDFDSSEAESFGIDDVFDGAEYIVRIRLPGEQAEHNGDYIDDEGYVVWDIDIANPDLDSLRLRTVPGETIIGTQAAPASTLNGGSGGGGGGGILKWVLIGLAIAALGALGWFLLQRNKGGAVAGAAAGLAGTATNVAGAVPGGAKAPPMPNAPVMPQATSAAETVMMKAPTPGIEPSAATPAAVQPLTPDQALEPTWDPARNSYVQWDATNSRWMRYDNATEAWAPEA